MTIEVLNITSMDMTVRFWGVKNNTVTKYPLVCDVNAMEKMHAYD